MKSPILRGKKRSIPKSFITKAKFRLACTNDGNQSVNLFAKDHTDLNQHNGKQKEKNYTHLNKSKIN